MVDVLLIIPKYVMSNITTVKKERGDETLNNIQFDPPLHVTYLAACLEKENLSVKLIDEGVLSLKHKNYDIIDYVKKENPLVIGVHVNSFSDFCIIIDFLSVPIMILSLASSRFCIVTMR